MMGMKPAIRFEGFTDDWEQRKLGELVQFSKGTGYSKADLRDSGTPVILYGRLYTKYETVISDVDTFAVAKAGSVYSRGGDVIVPASGETAEDISIASVVEKSGVLLGGDLNIITSPVGLEPTFLAISISNGKPHEDMAKMAQGKSVVHLHNSDLEKIDLVYPNYAEQVQISGFFHSLDNLITLHQRNYEKIVATKKSMLEKLFPQGNAKVPAIRFDGFSGDWEKRPLGTIADKSVEKNTEMLFAETFTNSAEKGIISQNDYFDHSISKVENLIGYFIVRADDFVYNPRISTTAPVGPINRNKLGRCGVMSPLYTVFTAHDIEPAYLEWFFKSSCWHAYMYHNGNTGARYDRFSISDSAFFKMPILVPSIEEQKQISGYLNSLDELIELYQIRIEKLKNIKAACLQGMFA